ncbi:MAG: hypothetical protein H0Z24_03340 [Thermosipho sp. (in: Bacteria)]|nr:hypothetical protein [Thermosipho sp. (in: thermotogales)]
MQNKEKPAANTVGMNEKDLGITGKIKKLNNTPQNTLLTELHALIGSMVYKEIEVEEYTFTDDKDFVDKQHLVFGNHYIAVDIASENEIRVVTEDPKAFIIDTEKISEKIYSVLFTSHIPRKIFINSKKLYTFKQFKKESVYDLGHIIQMFYGYKDLNLKEINELFKNKSTDDYNQLLYNLFEIKDKINTILEKHRSMKVLNKEMEIMEIVAKCEAKGLPFSEKEFENFLSSLESKRDKLLADFQERFGEIFRNKEELVQILTRNNLPASANQEFLEKENEMGILGLVIADKLLDKYKKTKLNFNAGRLYLSYNPYNRFGNIEADFSVDNYYIISQDKQLVSGSYQDFYLRILAHLSKIDYLIKGVNEGNLESVLAERIFGKNNNYTQFNSMILLDGFIQGKFTPEDMADFYWDHYDTYISDESAAMLMQKFAEKCGEVLDWIEEYEDMPSKDKRYSVAETTSVYKRIKLTEADIFKNAVALVYRNIVDFNKRNNEKIYIVGLFDNKIILESDENAVNIAIDTLNRNLERAFNRYIPNVKAVCNINAGNKLKFS